MKYRHHKPARLTPGFSLIELLLASSLSIFLLLGSAQLLIHTHQTRSRANHHLNSLKLVSARLEALRSCSHDSLELAEGKSTININDESSHQSYQLDWTIKEVSPDIKSVLMECSVLAHPEQKTRVILYISRTLGF